MLAPAAASGFGCVRRFNAAIHKTYHRTPSQLRRLARKTDAPENQYFFRLGFLDGKQGLIFHVLQGFWYRLLVDINIDQARAANSDGAATARKLNA